MHRDVWNAYMRFARELVGLKPDIILATSNSAIQAAKDATKSIPIVMAF
jgi:ABC-type uncharacterized transport system substrate-binding protein